MLDKTKKSEKVSFLSLLILLIGLILFIPILLNYKQVWGIGHFKFGENFTSDYSEGSVGIEIRLNLDYWQDTRCIGVIRVRAVASGNVQVHGITHIQYEVLTSGVRERLVNEILNPVVQSWNSDFIVSIVKDEIVTCWGFAEVNFSIGGLDQIIVLNFDMEYVVPMNVNDIFYTYDMPFLWIVLFYFCFLFYV